MNSQVRRAAGLLFPESGRRALDVKFFFVPGATVDVLSEQTILCFAALDDDSSSIANLDQGTMVAGPLAAA